MAIPVTNKLSDVFAYADQQSIASLLSKMGKLYFHYFDISEGLALAYEVKLKLFIEGMFIIVINNLRCIIT